MREDFTLVVEVNGKVRDKILVPVGISEGYAKKLALKSPRVWKYLEGRKSVKVIYVPEKLVNFVVK